MSESDVLLASSTVTDRKLFKNFFEDRPQNFVESSNGIDALDQFIDRAGSLVFAALDVDLPVRDGLDLVHLLKKSSSLSHVPVLLLVDEDQPELTRKARRSWAEAVLERPLDEELLGQRFDELALEVPLSTYE